MEKIKIITLLAITAVIVILVPVSAKVYNKPVFRQATEKTASLFFTPINAKGSNLTVKIMLNPGGQAVNAIGTIISFPAEILAINSINKDGSACEFFIDEEIDNNSGQLKFSCGTPTPGIEKESQLAQIIFTKKKSGWATLSFNDDSMVLANDGYSTNILKMLRGQKIYITK